MDNQQLGFEFERQVQGFVKTSFLTILVYDWLITFSDEVSYIWNSKWGIIKLLFIYTRYSTFIDTIISLHAQVGHGPVCGTTFETVFSGFGMGVCGLILMIWTYTLYERSRKVLAIFGLSWMGAGAVGIWAAINWSKTITITNSTAHKSSTLCELSQTGSLQYVLYFLLLGAETVVVLLATGKVLHIAGLRSLSRLAKVFNECGLLFYLGIYAFTLTDVLLRFIAPEAVFESDSALRVMHTILTCRLVLHLRAVAVEKVRKGEWDSRSDAHLGSQITTLRDLPPCTEDWEDLESRNLVEGRPGPGRRKDELC